MRRLFRHFFTLCSAASLLLCVAAAVLWVRTRFVTDTVTWTGPSGELLAVQSSGERLHVVTVRDWQDARPLTWTRHSKSDWPAQGVWPTGNLRRESFLGIRFFQGPGAWLESPLYAVLSLHPITVVSVGWDSVALWAAIGPAVAGTVWFRKRYLRRRREASGLCAVCGYDLRASPGRCPECGADGPRAGG